MGILCAIHTSKGVCLLPMYRMFPILQNKSICFEGFHVIALFHKIIIGKIDEILNLIRR